MFGKNKEKFNCEQDSQGIIHCQMARVLEDGTTETTASADFMINSECKPVPANLEEYEDGALERLHKKAMPMLRIKCQNKPQEY